MNPYEATIVDFRQPPDAGVSYAGTQIRATITYDGDYLVEALTRYRSQHLVRRMWNRFRYAIAIFFVIIAIASGLLTQEYWAPVFLVTIAVLMFFPHKLDNYLARRRLKSSPHCDERLLLVLSDDGYVATSSLQKTKLRWAVFTGAIAFPDGVLILHGKGMCHWLPFRCLEKPSDSDILHLFIVTRIATNKMLDRSGGPRVS